MRILALETSGTFGSVAVLDDECLLGKFNLPPPQRSAQSLVPAIAEQLAAVGWRPTDVQLIAVTQGPGSFTGLRVGITAAKTLAYAVGAEVLGVDTLEACAYQAPSEALRVVSVIDAQRQQFFSASFCRAPDGCLTVDVPTRLIDIEQWLAELELQVTVIGPGLTRVPDRLPDQVLAAPTECWQPQAVTVGQLAYRDYVAGRRDDLWKLVPHYFRSSAAEEKQRSAASRHEPEAPQHKSGRDKPPAAPA